jgi:hypothetical protein
MKLRDLYETRPLLEYVNLEDFRHANIEDKLPFWGGPKSDWVDPKDGFYFQTLNGDLEIFSTDNAVYSNVASTILKHNLPIEKKIDFDYITKLRKQYNKTTKDLWNQTGGLVLYGPKTIKISKESVGNKMRLRSIHDIKEFQKVLKDLKAFGVTDDFKVTNTSDPVNNKTVGEILMLANPVDKIFSTDQIIMYHGTSRIRYEEIKRIGLRPGKTGDVYNDLIAGYSDHNVYLATNAKGAEFYGKRQAKKDNDTAYVILKVTVPDNSKLMPDDQFAHRWVNSKDPKTLVSMIKMSIKEMSEIAYRGSIMPKFIELLTTRKST